MKVGIKMTNDENKQPHSYMTDEEQSVGVKEQNLFLDNATLTIGKDLTVEDTLSCRNLKISGNIKLPCDAHINGDLKNVITDLQETVLDGDFVISGVSDSASTLPHLKNIADPKSARDAITFHYFSSISPQSYHCHSEFTNISVPGNSFVGGDVLVFKGVKGTAPITVFENKTPLASEVLEAENSRVLLKKPGIYQVAYQMLRRGGDHAGNDDPTLFLQLNLGNSDITLCTGDTRGHSVSDETTTSLYAIFSLPVQSDSVVNTPYIYVKTKIGISPGKSSLDVVWFPYGQSYEEVD